jgi:hypothetical protein
MKALAKNVDVGEMEKVLKVSLVVWFFGYGILTLLFVTA